MKQLPVYCTFRKYGCKVTPAWSQLLVRPFTYNLEQKASFSIFSKNLQLSSLFMKSLHNERSSQAAKQLASVARKMVMREIPHCCQEDDGLQFLSTNLWYDRVLLLKRK